MVNNRSGAKVIPTPLPLSEKQRTRYAVHWILKASNGKPGRSLEERLAREIIAVSKGQSSALEEKLRVHRSAMVNRYAGLLHRPAGLKLMIAEGMSEPLISLHSTSTSSTKFTTETPFALKEPYRHVRTVVTAQNASCLNMVYAHTVSRQDCEPYGEDCRRKW